MALDPVSGALIGHAVSGLFNRSNSSYAAKKDFEYSKKLFEYENSNKYQFMVKDLIKAGINPMLAVGGLQGSSPSFSSASSSMGSTDDAGLNSAIAQREANKIAKEQTEIERIKVENEGKEKEANIKLIEALANSENTFRDARLSKLNVDISEAEHRMIIAENNLALTERSIANNERLTTYQIQESIANCYYLYEKADLTEQQKEVIKRDLADLSKKYERDVLSTEPGKDLYKLGFIIKILTQAVGAVGVYGGKFSAKIPTQ